jgi:hypothetical protein
MKGYVFAVTVGGASNTGFLDWIYTPPRRQILPAQANTAHGLSPQFPPVLGVRHPF